MINRLRSIGWMAAVVCAAQVGLPLAAHAQPVSDSDFISLVQPGTGENRIVIANPASDTIFSVAVLLDHASTLRDITIPLSFAGLDGLYIDTSVQEVAGMYGITYGPLGSSPPWAFRTSLVDNQNKTILLGFVSFTNIPPATDTLCYIHFYLNSDVRDLSIPIDTTALPPANHLMIVGPQSNVGWDFFECAPTWSPLTLTLGSGDSPPVLAPIGDFVADAGSQITFDVTATDPDHTVPWLSAVGLPAGASFVDHGDATGTFDWTPDSSQAGYHSVSFRASDGIIIDSEAVSILVIGANHPPVLAGIGDKTFRVESSVGITVRAADPDGTTPALSAAGLPLGASFVDHNDGSGHFDWNPGWLENGHYTLIFIASDGTFADSESVKLFVTKSGTYESDSDKVELIVPVTGAHDLYLPTVDHDTTFALALMLRNTSTLEILTVPIAFAGVPGLSLDATAVTPPDSVGISYGPAGETSLWGTRIVNVHYDHGVLLAFYQTQKLGPLDDTLCYLHFKLAATDTVAEVRVDSSWLAPGNVLDLQYADQGSAVILHPQWQGVTLHIGNAPPQLAYLDDQVTLEGENLCFDVSADDPDGTLPMLSAAPLPPGATFVDHGNGTGTFDWTPDTTDTGLHPVTFRASDGTATDSERITIIVGATSVGDDPTILPKAIDLLPNYPNPFNAATTIQFGLPIATNVRLDVYDALGRHVSSVFAGTRAAGWHKFSWNGRNDQGFDVGSGVYFFLLEAGDARFVRPATLLK